MAIKIALANQKGGVSKTTSTIEIAASLKNRNYSVLVVDLEQQADTTKYSGGDVRRKGVYEVLKETALIKEVIQKSDEFDILSASSELSKADDEFTKPTDVLKLRKALKDVNDDYDFIIIDTNPGRNRLLNMAYIAADYIIIPTDADDGSVAGIEAVFNDLQEYKDAEWSDAEVMGVIYAKYENTGMHRYQEGVIRELLDEKQKDAFLMKVRKGIAATECKTERTSMQAGKKYSNPAMDYRRIADAIIDRVTGE